MLRKLKRVEDEMKYQVKVTRDFSEINRDEEIRTKCGVKTELTEKDVIYLD